MHRLLIVASLLALISLPLAAQEEGGEKTFLIGLQLPVLQFVHYDNDTDFITFGVGAPSSSHYVIANPAPISLQFGFKPTDPLWILARFGFNMSWQDDDNIQNQLTMGVGARIDLPMDPIVAFAGLMLEYNFFDFPSSGNDLQCHGIGIIPFAGVEFMVTDYFGVGGQLQLGYLWLKQEAEAPGPLGGGTTVSTENHGMILALMLSASIYF